MTSAPGSHPGTASSHDAALASTTQLFLACLALPIVFEFGGLRLSPYRLVLLAMFLPCLIRWARGDAGPLRFPDFIVLLIAAWSALSFVLSHGSAGVESAGIVFIETTTPYFLARLSIQNLNAFKQFVSLAISIVLVLMPFALLETLTGQNRLNAIFDLVFTTYPDVAKPPRLGLDRVQGPFEHPILFGVFCGSVFALACYSLDNARRSIKPAVVFGTATLSLSSGPMSALMAQVGLIVWDRVLRGTRQRWLLLAVLVCSAYVIVDILSNRTPAEVFISYAAFNSDTAYNRILIWQWSWVNVWEHPWFGLGNGDWKRLWFMTPSVDMFWMHRAMVHGLPVGILNQVLIFWVMFAIARRSGLCDQASRIRTGVIVCLCGFFIAGMTVHFWNATFVWYMFVLGSAVWILDVQPTPAHADLDSRYLRSQTPKGLLA